MVIVKDNYLNAEDFLWLSTLAAKKANESMTISENKPSPTSKFYTNDNSAWDYTFRNLYGDMTRPTFRLGKHLLTIYDKVVNEIKPLRPVLPVDSVYFMFARTGYKIRKHIDYRFINTPKENLNKITKAFIFCNTVWQKDWGGELCFESGNYLPLPNRLVIYTPDETHWVEEVKDIGNNVRIIFGIRFGDEVSYEQTTI